MKHNINTLRALTLLAAGGILCLGIGTAYAQRAGRQVSHAAVGRATTNQATTSQAAGSQAACPAGSTSQSGTTSTTTSTAASGTTSQSSTTSISAQSSLIAAQRAARAAAAQQASGTVSAQRTASNQLLVQWSGNTSNVQRVYIGVLDANGQVIEQRAITQSPVQASLSLTASARYYGVQVVYANGIANTMYAPIR
jgi:hypothetical protein